MPAPCSPPRSSTSASIRCGRPRNSWRAPACPCVSTCRGNPCGCPACSDRSWQGAHKGRPYGHRQEALDMTHPQKLDQPEEYWDRLFAPSSCLAMITTVDADGRVNAASFGTCVRVNHAPVYIAFTTNM